MVDTVSIQIETLDLSAEDIKELTRQGGAQWPDQLVEDYLTIIRNTLSILDGLKDFELQVNENTENIDLLTVRVETNETDIANLTVRVGDNETNIANNETNIQTNADNFTNHINPVAEPDPHTQYGFRKPGLSMHGNVSSFTLTTIAARLENFTQSLAWDGADAANINTADGEITIPESGTYQTRVFITGDQGNATIDEMIYLQTDVNAALETVATFNVVQSGNRNRCLTACYTREFSANDVLKVFALATANLDTFTPTSATVEVIKIG